MKKVFAIVLSICLLVALVGCGAAKAPVGGETDTTPVAEEKTFTLIVVHSDGTEKSFQFTTTEEFVGPVLEAEGLIAGNAGPYGMEIITVDGEDAVYETDKAYWAVYEGDEYALQGIDTTPVVDGQTYKLVYTGA